MATLVGQNSGFLKRVCRPIYHYTNDNFQTAMCLYEWNLQLGAAVMRDIAHVEVAVRNRFDSVIDERWRCCDQWLFDQHSPVRVKLERRRKRRDGRKKTIDVNALNRRSIDEAIGRVKSEVTAGKVIAELPFGFWRHCTDSALDETLWIPFLNQAFSKGTDRSKVSASLKNINDMRNRIAHHEPIFVSGAGQNIEDMWNHILFIADRLIPKLGQYIRRTSSVKDVQSTCPVEM